MPGRPSIVGALVFGGLLLAAPAAAKPLDPERAEDAVEISRRIQCGVADEPAVYSWSGKVYARVEGEPDRLLFDGIGMNIRRCVAVTDPVRGTGFRQVSRELMLFTDPRTGAVLREWRNPWTGETVEVPPIANDPVNQRPVFARQADGSPLRLRHSLVGGWFQMPVEVPLFYDNPLGGDYQEFVGNKYHAMEIFDFAAPAAELLGRRAAVRPAVSWVRISDWMPWMKMRGRPGLLVFNAMGTKLGSIDELPKLLRDEIAARYPDYAAPPPGDDARPNATSWTGFKARIDADRKAAHPPGTNER